MNTSSSSPRAEGDAVQLRRRGRAGAVVGGSHGPVLGSILAGTHQTHGALERGQRHGAQCAGEF